MSALRKNEEDIVRLHHEDDLQTYISTLSGHGPMDEAVVTVDPDDDLTSVRTKLETTRVLRVVLVIPSRARTLKDGLEFRFLRRLQRELGLELMLVSDDADRRGYAQENGFSNIFTSLKAYYRAARFAPREVDGATFTAPEEFTPALRIGRWGLLVAGVLAAVLAAVAYLALPSATVIVNADSQNMARDVDVLVEVGGPRIDATAQRLAGRLLTERIQVQGTINVSDVPAPPSPQPAPGAGGLEPGRNITLEVRDALRQRLVEDATARAAAGLRAQLRENESLPDGAIRTEVTGERYDRNIGDAADNLGGTLEVVTMGLAFNNDDFNRLVLTLWSQDIPRDWVAQGEPGLTPPALVAAEGRRMTLRTHITGDLVREVDAAEIAAAVRGNTVQEAHRQIEAMDVFARPPKITLWPDWATRAYRVQVKTAAGQ